MWKRIAIVGATGAAILGTGAAALAVSGGSSPSAGSHSKAAGKNGKARGLRRSVHAQWTTRQKVTTFVQHEAIRGQVTSVSPSSVTIKAADGTSYTFAVNSATKVFHGNGKGDRTSSSIGDVKVGDFAGAIGKGAPHGTMTAQALNDRGTAAFGSRKAGSGAKSGSASSGTPSSSPTSGT